jgi:hypothetical protein
VNDNFMGVGVFHFGSDDKDDPIESLKVELRKLDCDVSGWLIVLPEGFNVVGGHLKGNPDQSIKRTLLEISESSRIAFVVGLIEADEKDRKFNLSYLLDGFETQQMLSWKHDPKSPKEEVRNPVCCATPIVHRGLAISAPICSDFSECSPDNQAILIASLKALKQNSEFLCVPAYSTLGSLNAAWENDWKHSGINVAVANGDKRDVSYVRGVGIPPCELASYREHSAHSHRDNEILLPRIDRLG